MSKIAEYLVLGMLGAALVTATAGCGNSVAQNDGSKAAFYGTPPPPSVQAQLQAQREGQAKAMAAAFSNKSKQ